MRNRTGWVLALFSLSACYVQPGPGPQPAHHNPQPAQGNYAEHGEEEEYAEGHGDYDDGGEYDDGGDHAGAGDLRDMQPVTCSGQQRVELAGVRIAAGDVAVRASGQCEVVISDSEIMGGVAGIVASGQSVIFVSRSLVRGQNSVAVSGQATLSSESSTYEGPIGRSGMARVEDRGGNRW